MKKYFNIHIVILGLFVALGLTGCYKQEVAGIVSPEGNPVATITTDYTGTSIREGESIVFNIALDQPLNTDLEFDPIIVAGSVGDAFDFEYTGGVVPAYSEETQLTITFLDDLSAEGIETIKLSIGVHSISKRYLMSVDQVYPTFEYELQPPASLLIGFAWDSEDDCDIVIYQDTSGYPFVNFSSLGATGANPEADNSIQLASDDGTYYVGIMNWDSASVDYTLTFELPDGTVNEVTGTFDADDLSKYFIDGWTDWGDLYNSYRVLKIVKEGSNFTYTKLDELTSADYLDVSGLAGEWGGYDGTFAADFDWRFTSHINTYVEDGVLTIDSLNYDWMWNIWGEEFQEIYPVEMIMYANGDVFIPFQDYCITWYDANEDAELTDDELFPYSIYGTGKYTGGELLLEYELDQAGYLVAADFAFSSGYSDIPYFITGVSLGSKSLQMEHSIHKIPKPKR